MSCGISAYSKAQVHSTVMYKVVGISGEEVGVLIVVLRISVIDNMFKYVSDPN